MIVVSSDNPMIQVTTTPIFDVQEESRDQQLQQIGHSNVADCQSILTILKYHVRKHVRIWIAIIGITTLTIVLLITLFLLPQHPYEISSPPPTSSPPSTSNNPLLIKTADGLIQGFYLSFDPTTSGDLQVESVVNVSAWRAIPFSKPPIGQLRWASPTPVDPWDGILLTNKFAPPCVQPLGDPMGTGSEGSEDCLYLNVYSFHPTEFLDLQEASSLLPVLFYIHGGGLMAGWGGEEMTAFVVNAGKLRAGGLVLVQVNYRLNLFGFLANEQLSSLSPDGASGNYGIQDQLLALQWVQKNIRSFGGDPNCVTIAGQSSGGTSVFALMSSPLAKGLFSAGISLSGSPNITTSLSKASNQNSEIFIDSLCNQFSFGATQNASKFVDCIRQLNVSELQTLIPNDWNTPGLWGMPMEKGQNYDAVVIVDGITISDSFESALALDLISIPLLFGGMAYEPDEYPDKIVSNFTVESWHSFLNDSFVQFDQKYRLLNGTTGSSLFNIYKNESTINPQMAYDAIVSDYGLTCASPILAKNALPPLGRFSSNLYTYVNEWGLSHDYIVPDLNGYVSRFAHHEVDLWMLTETWNLIGNGTYTPSSRDLLGSRYLQSLWYDFMVLKGNLSLSVLFNGWAPVDDCDDWPSNCYNMFVIRPPENVSQVAASEEELLLQLQYASTTSKVIENYKSNVCSYFSTIGINDMSYWWCN